LSPAGGCGLHAVEIPHFAARDAAPVRGCVNLLAGGLDGRCAAKGAGRRGDHGGWRLRSKGFHDNLRVFRHGTKVGPVGASPCGALRERWQAQFWMRDPLYTIRC
jgi:hypothetical protein